MAWARSLALIPIILFTPFFIVLKAMKVMEATLKADW